MQRKDEDLVSAYLNNGDELAFGELVRRHQERVFGYLVGMVRDRDIANDLFQETYFRVIRALNKERGSYSQQGRWIHWVMRIARNAALDHLRSRKKWVDVSLHEDPDGDDYWQRVESDDIAPDEILFRTDQSQWLEECIEKLSPDQREVLLLRHEGDMTFKEIAELTNCSINTALGRMRYALLNLRQMMLESSKEHLSGLTS